MCRSFFLWNQQPLENENPGGLNPPKKKTAPENHKPTFEQAENVSKNIPLENQKFNSMSNHVDSIKRIPSRN